MSDRRPRPILSLESRFWPCLLIAAGIVVASISPAPAQDSPRKKPPPAVKLSGSAGAAGIGVYQNDRWGIVQATVNNPTDIESRVRVYVTFDTQTSHQFGTTVTVPARSTRQIQMPVRTVGAEIDGKRGQLGNRTLLFDADDEREIDNAIGLVRAVEDSRLFLVVSDSSDADDEAARAVEMVRETAGLSKTMAYAAPSRLMRFGLGWDGVKTAIYLNDDFALDGAQTRAMLDWLNGGGTLVVFADQVDPDAARRVLGEDFTVAAIDRVTLTTLNYIDISDSSIATVHTEQPYHMTRVVAPGFDTHISINGWPALLSRDYGRGRVVVVAAEGRAWTDVNASDAMYQLVDLLLPGGMLMGTATSQSTDVLEKSDAMAFVNSQIGRSVVSRNTVAAVLIGFVVVLAIIGVLVGRKAAGEWLGVIGAVAALVATAVLLGLGYSQSSDIDPTAAAIQLVQVQPDRATAQVHSISALYDPAGGERAVNGKTGWAWPIPTDAAGRLYRMTWEDLDAWTWPKVELPADASLPLRASQEGAFANPIRTEMRYGPDGLTGGVSGIELSDAIVATGQVNIGATHNGEKIDVPASAVLDEGVYFQGNVLDNIQQDRAALLDALISSHRYKQPTLLAWSSTSPSQVNVSPDLTRNTQALYEIPLRVSNAEPGDKVRVPWPLIEMIPQRVSAQKFGLVVLPLWRPDKQTWIEDGVPGASAFIADFQLPPQVQPLKITGAKIHLDITAPGRPVRVMSIKNGKPVELKKIDSPDGPVVLDVDPTQFEIQSDGRIKLAFEVANVGGAPPGSRTVQQSDIWTIRYFGLEVAGTVSE